MTKLIQARQMAREDDLDSATKKWSRVLNLDHWSFHLSKKVPQKGHLMEIAINRLRRVAHFRVSEAAWKSKDFEKLVVHELVHVVLDDLEYEHAVQIAPLHPPVQREYSARYKHQQERVVENLANSIYNLATVPH